MHRREGLGGSLRSCELASDDAYESVALRETQGGNLVAHNTLVTAAPSYPWRANSPTAAPFRTYRRVARTRDHETLRGPGRKRRSSTAHRQDQLSHRHRRIPVCHFTLVDDGDRLEATMWVLADATALVRRRKSIGPA